MRFGTKLAFIFILIGTVPLLVGGAFLFNFFDDYLEFSVRNNLEKISTLKACEINDYINQNLLSAGHLVEIIKEEKRIVEEDERELGEEEPRVKNIDIDNKGEEDVEGFNEIYLNSVFYNYYNYFFDKFLIVNDSAHILKSSTGGQSGVKWEETFWFEMSMEKDRVVMSDIVVDNVEQKEMVFAIFTPFKIEGESYMLIVEKSVDNIFSILDFRLGGDGDVMLINGNGLIVFSHNKNYKFLDANKISSLREVVNENRIKNGSLNFNIDGIMRVGGFHKIDDLQWTIVVSMVEADALIFLARMAVNYIFLTVTLLLPIVFTSFLVSRKIIKPLKNISLASKKVATGDFDVRATAKSNDEFGELARNFNKMTIDLKEARKTLEEEKQILEVKVKARTKALKELNENLEKKVEKRTEDMERKINELEKMSRLMVGRELKMGEMKKEIEKIKKENMKKNDE